MGGSWREGEGRVRGYKMEIERKKERERERGGRRGLIAVMVITSNLPEDNHLF